MSIHVLSAVLRQSPAKLGARLVHIALAEFAHDDGTKAFPAVETLMERTLLSRRGVQDALRKLEEAGLIEQAGTTRSGTRIYTVHAGARNLHGGAENGAGGAQISTSRGAAAAPNPSETRQKDPNPSPEGVSQEEPVGFAQWLGQHHGITDAAVPRAGTTRRATLARTFGRLVAEGHELEEFRLASVGVFSLPHMREGGHLEPENVLRVSKFGQYVSAGERHEAQSAGSRDWSRFDG